MWRNGETDKGWREGGMTRWKDGRWSLAVWRDDGMATCWNGWTVGWCMAGGCMVGGCMEGGMVCGEMVHGGMVHSGIAV